MGDGACASDLQQGENDFQAAGAIGVAAVAAAANANHHVERFEWPS